MKNQRQAKILELIEQNAIETQGELQALLRKSGFQVTQATVSRDIRELGIVKAAKEDGFYSYVAGGARDREALEGRFALILKQAACSVASANNLVVVKTYTGMGSAAGAAFDAMQLQNVIGSLAGDDTLLIIAADNESAGRICTELRTLLEKER